MHKTIRSLSGNGDYFPARQVIDSDKQNVHLLMPKNNNMK